jgi:hypothetical protein
MATHLLFASEPEYVSDRTLLVGIVPSVVYTADVETNVEGVNVIFSI